ncbi:precorrin-3B C(17)-methyltransferase [Brevibacillus sp. SYSU BS000544]|uniref:precorrin-3B C(17)-methyltransferase n=1 Tax=Brevibacillus sp. SYSU BS000544 TaxID=3416443 RepID=UPI003CE50D8D
MSGKLLVIGFGPGSEDHITKRAKEAIEESNIIIGYNTYVDLIKDLLTTQEVLSTGMTEEVARAREAVRQAELGHTVAVISSGDAGVYGMAGLIYEVLVEKGWREAEGVKVEVIPGISAINSCAALLGAPTMHDACTISLSDHLTPWELIAKRIDAAASADFVIALYNPKSGKRTRQIEEAKRIISQYRSPDTPVGLVKSAYRDRQKIEITTLEHMLDCEIGMLSTVIVGNSSTFMYDGKMITPRGYQRKYTLTKDEQPLALHQRLRKENEPWALDAVSPIDTVVETVSTSRTPFEWAMDAVQAVKGTQETASASSVAVASNSPFQQQMIFECAVSPGVVSKKLSPAQLVAIAEVAGDTGEIEYTPHHQIILRIPTSQPDEITNRLKQAGLLVMPVGDVVQIKACDFCNGEKPEGIPYAEALQERLGGLEMPKELRIGINGCGMTCYSAVNEDIGLVYRAGKFDLFLGAKTVGRNAHAGVPVAEGIDPSEIIFVMEQIVAKFKQEAFPNERFHKFFKRKGVINGFIYQEGATVLVDESACGE